MTLVSQADFARLLGVNRSTVSRTWKQAGRLVMVGDKVDVDASRIKLEETGGMRFDVAARHAAQRAAPIAEPPPADEMPATARNYATTEATNRQHGIETRAEAQARKESAAADLLEMEKAQKLGQLIPRADVDAAMRHLGAAVRSAMDVFPDQTAPLVAPVRDMDEVHSLLAESCRNVLAGIDDALARQQAALASQKDAP